MIVGWLDKPPLQVQYLSALLVAKAMGVDSCRPDKVRPVKTCYSL